jgi:predicted transcriptional regulator
LRSGKSAEIFGAYDVSTLKKTLEDLEKHKCIKVSDPTSTQCRKKNPTYDDKIIKLSKGLKDIDLKKFLVFYYSVARAFICHQITQNEYKVYLCILNNYKNGKSCTLEKISKALDMEKGHILRAIKNLEIASLLKVDRLPPNDMGKKHNMYYPKDTDRWDDVTDIELDDNMVSGLNISLIA